MRFLICQMREGLLRLGTLSSMVVEKTYVPNK
jgi:hypothetical protein